MSTLSALLGKEMREHGLVLLLLLLGFLSTVTITLLSMNSATFSVTPLEVIRAEVIWILPLLAFILGNLLVVREYLHKTRLFVEALPIRNGTLFWFKYFFGLGYLFLLTVLCVTLAVLVAQRTDIIDSRFVFILLARSLAIVMLVWSIVLCFSLCGKLRLVLYFILIALVLYVVFDPSIDERRLAPIALLDAELFAFENHQIPWRDLFQTLALALAFLVIAWLLVNINEGSVAEMLSKPLSRRDYVALGVLILGALTLLGSIAERWEIPEDNYSGDLIVSSQEPPVSIMYATSHRAAAEQLLAMSVETISAMQARLGIAEIPRTRISLDLKRSVDDLDYRTLDGVLVTANYVDADAYEHSTLQAVVLHQLLQGVTQWRAQFEPWHWLLDGVTRWLAVSHAQDTTREIHNELIARAVHVESDLPADADLGSQWQILSERYSYPSTEALAYSMVNFLLETIGENELLILAQAHLAVSTETTSLVSLREKLDPFTSRFARMTGRPWSEFHREWRDWLKTRGHDPEIAERLQQLPQIEGFVRLKDAGDAPVIEAGYRVNDVPVAGLICVLRHRRVGPFNVEVSPRSGDSDEQPCQYGDSVHRLEGEYGFGDRVLIALEYTTEVFHDPIRILARRVTVQ